MTQRRRAGRAVTRVAWKAWRRVTLSSSRVCSRRCASSLLIDRSSTHGNELSTQHSAAYHVPVSPFESSALRFLSFRLICANSLTSDFTVASSLWTAPSTHSLALL